MSAALWARLERGHHPALPSSGRPAQAGSAIGGAGAGLRVLIVNVALGLFGVLWLTISQQRGEMGFAPGD
jgi:hypothetical protein